jgi:tetratricopeptide (TPR) repeat protein
VASAHLELEQLEAALASAELAASSAPSWEWPHRLRSVALLRDGRAADAVDAALSALVLEPDLWAARVQLAYALGGAQRWQAAFDAANGAVALAPEEADAHAAVGYAALGMEWRDVAERAFLRALELDPQHAAAHNNLALVRLQRRDLRSAASGFTAAVTADPTDSEEAADNLAWLLLRAVWPAHAGLLAGVTVFVVGTRSGASGAAVTLLIALVLGAGFGWVAHRARGLPAPVRGLLRRRLASVPGRVGVGASGLLALLLVLAPPLDLAGRSGVRDAALGLLLVGFLGVLAALS